MGGGKSKKKAPVEAATGVVPGGNAAGGGATTSGGGGSGYCYTAMESYEKIRKLISDSCNISDLPALFAAVDTDGSGEIDRSEWTAFVVGFASEGVGGQFTRVPQDEIDAAFRHIDYDHNGTIDLHEFEKFFFVADSVTAGVDARGVARASATPAEEQKETPESLAAGANGTGAEGGGAFKAHESKAHADKSHHLVGAAEPYDYTNLQTFEGIRKLISDCVHIDDLPSLFASVDTDGSGAIDRHEWRLFLVGLADPKHGGLVFHPPPQEVIDASFKYIDTDGNGVLDFQEFEKFFFVSDSVTAGVDGRGTARAADEAAAAAAQAAQAEEAAQRAAIAAENAATSLNKNESVSILTEEEKTTTWTAESDSDEDSDEAEQRAMMSMMQTIAPDDRHVHAFTEAGDVDDLGI